jgi:hypothetical protein
VPSLLGLPLSFGRPAGAPRDVAAPAFFSIVAAALPTAPAAPQAPPPAVSAAAGEGLVLPPSALRPRPRHAALGGVARLLGRLQAAAPSAAAPAAAPPPPPADAGGR